MLYSQLITASLVNTYFTSVFSFISQMQVPWKHLWNTVSETHRASKKCVFPNWCLQAVCEVKFYFQYRHFVNCFLSHLCTQSWSSWCIGPYWNTHTSHKPHGLHSPLYICSWLISHITLTTKCPCTPGSCPGLSASSHSKLSPRLRNQVAAPSPTSLGPIPQDRKQHLSPVPNKHCKQQPPSQPTNLTSSTTSWIYNIFPSGDF